MEKRKNSNKFSVPSYYNNLIIKKKVGKKPIKHIKNIYMSRTFASKLFIKLCRNVIDPIIICLQTLKYEPENRKQEEIESTIPYLKTLENFNHFINFLENEKTSFDLMVRFARIMFYYYHAKNSIVKRPGDSNDIFFIILNGEVYRYNLIFEIENLTLEQYLMYLIELELINENEIINKCFSLNKDIINVDKRNDGISIVEKFVKKGNKFSYKEMQKKAKKELTRLGFNMTLYKNGKLRKVPNIENYLKIFEILGKFIDDEGKNKFHFYVGKYKLCSKLIKGQFFNFISEINLKDSNLYVCETNTDLGQIKREEFIKSELSMAIDLKMKRLFQEVKNHFFILRGIDDDKFFNNYTNLFLYKKYKKGDKIFFQGGYFNGMYLILEGNISIYTSSSIEKLCNHLFSIVNSVTSFSEYIPSFNGDNIIQDFNNLHQLLYRSIKISHEEYISKKQIDISVQNKYDILGFYELYNNKTDLYNFTAECVSDNAIMLLIPRNNLNIILGKEQNLYKNLISLVEMKIQFIVGKFKTFVHQIMANYRMTLKNSLSIPKINLNKNKNNRYKIINNRSNSNNNAINCFTQQAKRISIYGNINSDKIINKINDEKKNDSVYNNPNLRSYNYFEALNNFKKELNKKHRIDNEIALNKNNNIFIRSSFDNFYTPNKNKLNFLDNNLLNNNFVFKNRNNIIERQKKKNIYKSINFTTYNSNHVNNYFSLNTIGENNNENNQPYQPQNRKYKVFPMINQQQNNLFYK